MENCIFCKIVNKEIPADIVFENDMVMAFLDNNPISLGHVLIVPKKHFENIYDISEEYLKELMLVTKKIALAYREFFGISDLNLIHNAGKDGQQVIFHFHLHLIPRKAGDGINFSNKGLPELKEKYPELLEKLKGRFR